MISPSVLLVIVAFSTFIQPINQGHIRKPGAGWKNKIAEKLIQRHRGDSEQLYLWRAGPAAANHTEYLPSRSCYQLGAQQDIIAEQGGQFVS